MDLKDPYVLKRFRKAVDHSRQKLQPFRVNRLDMLQQYLGTHYGEDGPPMPVPLMFLEMAVSVYMHQLVGGTPRAMVRTKHAGLKPAAADLSLALNYVTDEINLEDTLLLCVQDAIFCMGIVKIGLAETEDEADRIWWHEQWQPYVERVDIDDWVHDTNATSWSEVAFEGNRYRIPLEEAKDSEDFDKKAREMLVATRKTSLNEEGDDKASALSGVEEYDMDEVEDYVELWDYYIGRTGEIVTLATEQDNVPALKMKKWTGPSGGPFKKLGFNPVPSNLMPLPPVAVWRELHDIANILYRKLGRQGSRQKTVLPVRGGNPADIKTIRESGDGDILRMDGEVAKEVRYGGPDQTNLAFLLSTLNIANRQAGNLDTLGGLRSSADTLGQEQMLADQASGRIVYMKRRLMKFGAEINNSLAFYLFQDPFVNLTLEKTGPDPMSSIPKMWGADTREGDYRKFNIQLDEYSLVPKTPQTQLQSIVGLLKTIILPLMPLLQAQGISIKMESLLKKLAELSDTPEIADFLHFAGEPQQYERGPVGAPQGDTKHTSERISGSGPKGAGADANLAQMLMGAVPGASEMPGLGGGQ